MACHGPGVGNMAALVDGRGSLGSNLAAQVAVRGSSGGSVAQQTLHDVQVMQAMARATWWMAGMHGQTRQNQVP